MTRCFVSLVLDHANPRVDRRLGWVDETFKNRTSAEHALNDEYIAFKNCKDIMGCIPPATRALISRDEPEAPVRGFRQFFGYLDEEVARDGLRRLVVGFFKSSDYLAEHLS